MTRKQKLFVSEYLIDMNATRAAERAGYSKKALGVIGHDLLKHPNVKKAIDDEIEARKSRNQITADYVLTRLRENVERAMQEKPVLNSEGEQTGEFKYEGAVANKALELLGRHLGLFPTKTEIGNIADNSLKITTIKIVDSEDQKQANNYLEGHSNGQLMEGRS
jgi:phage terminase small subunit